MTGSVPATQNESPTILRVKVLDVLARILADWEVAANCESLINIKGSVGLILFDLATRLELTPAEVGALLGSDLHNELIELTRSRDNIEKK